MSKVGKIVDDSELPLYDYWKKHRYDIANLRGWECKADCPNSCLITCLKNRPHGSADCRNSCADSCLRHCKAHRLRLTTHGTLKFYESFFKKLNHFLKQNISISELTYFDVQHALNQMINAKKGRPYKSATRMRYLSCLNILFRYAEDHGHASNIFSIFGISEEDHNTAFTFLDPKVGKEEVLMRVEEYQSTFLDRPRSLTIAQTERLVHMLCNTVEEDGRCMAMAVCLYMGLRPAEARALRWKDFHPFTEHSDREYVMLYHTRDKKGIFKNTMKTPNAYRKIPVHAELSVLLNERRNYVSEKYHGPIDDLPVCCFENHFDQPCKDYQLACYAEKRLSDLKLKAVDMIPYFVDAVQEQLSHSSKWDRLYDEEALSLYVLRRNFFTWISSSTPLGDFDKRYLMGHTMLMEFRDLRSRYNDEDLLWEFCQAMDQGVLCAELHRPGIAATLVAGKTIKIANHGVVEICIGEEILKSGGTIVIDAMTTQPGDAVVLNCVGRIQPISNISFTVGGWPAESQRNMSHLVCEYEDLLAHQRIRTRHPSKKLKNLENKD